MLTFGKLSALSRSWGRHKRTQASRYRTVRSSLTRSRTTKPRTSFTDSLLHDQGLRDREQLQRIVTAFPSFTSQCLGRTDIWVHSDKVGDLESTKQRHYPAVQTVLNHGLPPGTGLRKSRIAKYACVCAIRSMLFGRLDWTKQPQKIQHFLPSTLPVPSYAIRPLQRTAATLPPNRQSNPKRNPPSNVCEPRWSIDRNA